MRALLHGPREICNPWIDCIRLMRLPIHKPANLVATVLVQHVELPSFVCAYDKEVFVSSIQVRLASHALTRRIVNAVDV